MNPPFPRLENIPNEEMQLGLFGAAVCFLAGIAVAYILKR